MADILIVGDEVSPIAESEVAICAAALAKALSADKHKVTILTLAAEDRVAKLPGMARRLRTVQAHLADGDTECSLFEGRSPVSQCALQVLGTAAVDRGHAAALLAGAAAALIRDEICKPDAIIAWGETSAAVFRTVTAPSRIFVLPAGAWGSPLSHQEQAALDPDAPDLAIAKGSLAGLGAVDADVVVFPSPSSAERFQRAREFSFRASDQAVVSVRFGCDDSPFDPATDQVLPTAYSAEFPSGKNECRRALARRLSLALGPRTLVLATERLTADKGGTSIVEALPAWVRSDVAVVVPASGDRGLIDEVKRIAIESPGKIAIHVGATKEADRQILAGADALFVADRGAPAGRAAGLAMRYGTLVLAPDVGSYRDYVVDYDRYSRTGNGLLYKPDDAYERVSVALRAAALRGNPDIWPVLQRQLLQLAPRWNSTATQFASLFSQPAVA